MDRSNTPYLFSAKLGFCPMRNNHKELDEHYVSVLLDIRVPTDVLKELDHIGQYDIGFIFVSCLYSPCLLQFTFMPN
jgi:hypothetical protein